MKKLKILLVLIASICFLLSFGCNGCNGEIEVELLEPAFRPDVYVNKEFDVMTALDEPNKKYKYEIVECFYLDNNLDKFDIAYNGTKFTQSLGYDVFVTLQVKYLGKTKILEFELTTYIEQTPIQQAYINSYSVGTQKLMSVNPDYLTENESTAIKVTVNAVSNNQSEGTQSGLFNFKSRSNTSWDNVVLTMNVFNTYERDMMIGLNFQNASGNVPNGSMFDKPQIVPSGKWAKCTWSLRALGYNYDLVASKVSVGLRTMLPNTTDIVGPWQYTFYICGLDICDYSQEKFPDLDTRTVEEKAQDNTLDANDVYLQTHNRELGTVVLSSANTYTTANLEKYSNSTLAKPDTLENSKSFVKYDIFATKPNNNHYVSTAFNFKVGYTGNPVSANELDLYTVTDWRNAFVGMWVYNDSELDICVRAKSVTGLATKLNAKQWTYVEYSLAQVYNVTTNVFTQDDYNLRLYFVSASTGMDTLETYKNYNATLYVDGFDIYNKTPNSYDTTAQAFIGSAIKNYETGYTYFYTNLEVSEDSTVKYNGENSIKYVVSDDGRSPNASRRYFAPMVFDELNPFSALLSTYGLSYSDISDEYRVRFYVKNDSAHKLRFIWMQGNSINLNAVVSAIESGTPYVDVLANSNWTKVDLPLSEIYEGLISNHERIHLCAGFLSTGSPFEPQTYYMSGFEVYKPTTNDLLVNSAVSSYADSQNSYQYFYSNLIATNESSVQYNGENTVKYLVADDGRSPSASRRWFVPFEFDADNKFTDLLTGLDIDHNTINKNSRICFYVKNTSTSYKLDFVFMNSYKEGGWFGLNQISTGNGSYLSGVKAISVAENSDWVKIEFPISDVYDDLITGTGRISLCAGYLRTGEPFAEQIFYLGGFDVYTPTAQDIIPAYATSVSTNADWNKAGVANATTDTLQGEKVVKYDVSIGEVKTHLAATNKGMNVMANMFVAKSTMPSELLSVCNVTGTSWNKIRISFKVYSDVVVGFSAFYSVGGSGIIGSNDTPQVQCTAGEWTTVTFELDITSPTFTTGYNLVIVGRSFCPGTTAEWQVEGKHAYTYYVKDFNLEEITIENLLPDYATSIGKIPDWYKAGEANATTDTLQDEKVVKYDVSIRALTMHETPAVGTGSNAKVNVMANMFVAKSTMPSELLSMCGITKTSWTKMTISFNVYSEVAVGFSAFYNNASVNTSTIISSAVDAQQECTAGEWTTVTFELDITSATFTTDYMLVIVGRSFCAGTKDDWRVEGKHAYTYYVKDFNITVD